MSDEIQDSIVDSEPNEDSESVIESQEEDAQDEGQPDELPEPEPAKDDRFDKLISGMESLTQAMNRNANTPNQQNQKGVEKAQRKLQTRLKDYLETDGDLLDAGQKTMIEGMIGLDNQMSGMESLAAKLGKIESELQEQKDRANFAANHPHLAGKYDELLDKAAEQAEQMVGEVDETDPISVARWEGAMQAAFRSIVTSESGKTRSEKVASSHKKPSGANTINKSQSVAATGKSGGKEPKRGIFGRALPD